MPVALGAKDAARPFLQISALRRGAESRPSSEFGSPVDTNPNISPGRGGGGGVGGVGETD